MLNIVIVNCFDTYEDRIDLLHSYFDRRGYNVKIIQSNFRHIKKIYRNDKKKDFIFLETKPYYKNLSASRMISHFNFSKEAFNYIEKIKPNILYVVLPPNSLAYFASKFKKKNKDIKLVFDIIDLWPETMPFGKIKTLPPFNFWKAMRDKSLKFADYIITECDLYQTILEKELFNLRTKTVYLAQKNDFTNIKSNPKLPNNEINLCYLGSINNIIDIQKIKEIVEKINYNKPTTLHIIGEGEKKSTLINEIKEVGANVKYYGKIYDFHIKQEIFDICHFGINIMKDTVCVGLTMKSIDYFRHGLPIINNIKADTQKLVDKYNIGINIIGDNINEVVYKILNTSEKELYNMRQNSVNLFNNLFTQKVFENKIDLIIKELSL